MNVTGQRAFGTPVELLMTEQAIELEAWWDVTRTTIAADEPESGHLDPIAATLELLERARGNGAELGIGKDVSVVEMGRGGLAGVKTSVNRLAAPLIVVTPWPWMNSVLVPLGLRYGLLLQWLAGGRFLLARENCATPLLRHR